MLTVLAMAATSSALSSGPPLTSLRRAAGHTDPALLQGLLARLSPTAEEIDEDVDESGRSALHHACWRGSIENVHALLDMGVDMHAWSTGIHSYGKTPIFYALTMCRDNVVEALLERGRGVRERAAELVALEDKLPRLEKRLAHRLGGEEVAIELGEAEGVLSAVVSSIGVVGMGKQDVGEKRALEERAKGLLEKLRGLREKLRTGFA